MKKLITLSIVTIASFFSISGVTNAASCRTVGIDNAKANSLFKELNIYRNEHYIFSLNRNSYLNMLAAHKGYEYAQTKQWAHDINGKTWLQIYRECGSLSYTKLGENLAREMPNAKTVIDFWANTPIHKTNALDLRHRNVGIFVGGPEIEYYTVAVFMN